jgi:hypothetical protein
LYEFGKEANPFVNLRSSRPPLHRRSELSRSRRRHTGFFGSNCRGVHAEPGEVEKDHEHEHAYLNFEQPGGLDFHRDQGEQARSQSAGMNDTVHKAERAIQ